MRVEYAEIGLIVGGVVIAILAIARSRAGGLQLLLGMIGLGAGWYFRPPGGFEDVILVSPDGEVFIREPAWLGLLSVSALLALFGLAHTIQGRKASAAEGGPAQNDLRSADADVAAWDRIADKSNADALREYLLRHPEGRFAELARIKLERTGGKPLTPAAEKAPPWASTTVEDDLLFPSEKAARPAEPVKPARMAERAAPRDDLFAVSVSVRPRYSEPQGSAAPLIAFLLVMLAAGAGGGAWWWFNGGAALVDGVVVGGEASKPVEQVAEGEPLPMPPPAEGPAEQVEATAAAAAPLYDVQPPTNAKVVLVKGSNVRLRTSPFTSEETGVVAIARAGAALRVTGRVTRPDWIWYEVRMDDGRQAFVRSDLTSAPERGPDAPRNRAAPPLVASSPPLMNTVRPVEATPSPPVEVPPLQAPVANDQPASVPPATSAAAPAAAVPASVTDAQPAG